MPSTVSATNIRAKRSGRIATVPIPRARTVVNSQPLPTEGLVRFEDRGEGQCAYPMWPDTESNGLVCGRPSKPGSSYCHAHHSLCWNRVEKR